LGDPNASDSDGQGPGQDPNGEASDAPECDDGPSPVTLGCGNNLVETGEACDGADLGDATCISLGFDGGELGCTEACGYDTSLCVAPQCTSCGDCEGRSCIDGRCAPCETDADCCAPFACFFGACVVF
jgi:hypothetical protein